MKFGQLMALLLVLSGIVPAQDPQPATSTAAPDATALSYVPVEKFDSKRDAVADIRAAITEAQRTGKRIMLDVGGDWCTWCHVLDKFLAEHPAITDLRNQNFITVAVFYGHDNKNEKALAPFGKLEGIPHLFVLEKDGTLLHSQGIVKLETGGEPDSRKFKAFLLKWSPGQLENTAKTK